MNTTDSLWSLATLRTVSEMLLQAGHERVARLLSLTQRIDAPPPGTTRVTLRVRPIFLPLFAGTDLHAIGTQITETMRYSDAVVATYEAVVAPALTDPLSPGSGLASGTDITTALRGAVADTLAMAVKSYDLPAACVGYGLDDGDPSDAHASKRAYIRDRIRDYTDDQVLDLATRVVNDHFQPDLWGLVELHLARRGGVATPFRNLIFAANGPKPRLVLRDAVSNVIEIMENAEFCLIYDRPLPEAGLTWADLVDWWARQQPLTDVTPTDAANGLHARLVESLDLGVEPDPDGGEDGRGPEHRLFAAYITLVKEHGFKLPALIPQVYLHYDPRTRAQYHRNAGPLPRQRMDFLLLLGGRRRIVIEVDGRQHYADGTQASPHRYAEMVAEDRRLRLDGYEVYRFGGAELHPRANPRPMLRNFFIEVLDLAGR